MAQVNNFAGHRNPSTVDAFARAIEAYNAFKQAGRAGSEADYYDQKTDQDEAAADRAQRGILDPDQQVTAARAGITFNSSPQPGAIKAYLTQDPETPVYLSPPAPKAELRAPNYSQARYQDEKGQTRIGAFDPESGKIVTSPNDPLAEKQQKSDAAIQAAADLKANQRASDKNDKAFHETQQFLEQMRGNPAAQQAEKDIYAAGKANSLIEKLGGGDPNNLTPQATALLVSEIGKIAAGGAPTEHELDTLNPQTLNQRFAGIWQRLKNDPTPANAGAFLKQYKDYADSLTEDAQKVVTDRYGRILESNKSRLSPSDYESLKSNYLDRFKDAAKAADARLSDLKSSNGGNGDSGFGIANAAEHPEAQQALDWANSHPDDPRSKTILQRLGK